MLSKYGLLCKVDIFALLTFDGCNKGAVEKLPTVFDGELILRCCCCCCVELDIVCEIELLLFISALPPYIKYACVAQSGTFKSCNILFKLFFYNLK